MPKLKKHFENNSFAYYGANQGFQNPQPQNLRRNVMCVVKVIGMVLLAVYLLLTGMVGLYEATPGPMMKHVMDLFAVGSGILILLSVGKACHHHEE